MITVYVVEVRRGRAIIRTSTSWRDEIETLRAGRLDPGPMGLSDAMNLGDRMVSELRALGHRARLTILPVTQDEHAERPLRSKRGTAKDGGPTCVRR